MCYEDGVLNLDILVTFLISHLPIKALMNHFVLSQITSVLIYKHAFFDCAGICRRKLNKEVPTTLKQ